MKKYLIIIVALIVVYVFTMPEEINFDNNNFDNRRSVLVSYNEEELSMSIDDYVLGVLACEMPALFDEEALKAGAVAIRTFYKYNKLKNNNYVAKNTEQCFADENKMRENWDSKYDVYLNKLKNAISETSNEYITYEGDIIASFYFSLSNGYTESANEVFSKDLPYLVSVPSTWDENVKTFKNILQIDIITFLNKLGLPQNSNVLVKDVIKTDSGRIKQITINDKAFNGIDVRKLLNLKSTDFEIEVYNGMVNVITKGYGHGVGLSQYGANEMAKLGYKYDEILTYYKKKKKISKLDV